MRSPAFALAIAAILAAWVAPAGAQEKKPFAADPAYADCIATIADKPKEAFDKAQGWRARGGGIGAEHCAALALIELDQPGEAAVRFEAIARKAEAGSLRDRTALFDQAGNAWLLAKGAEEAENAFAEAIKLSPRDPALWIDRAQARAMQKDWRGAETDLNAAINFDRSDPSAFVLRASARSALGRRVEARTDIDAALAISPDFPDALVERGAMKRAAGDRNGARADWIRVLSKSPKTSAAESARAYIEALDFNPDR